MKRKIALGSAEFVTLDEMKQSRRGK